MNNKILMIINIFPPSGESGIQRPVKFLKYLARDGWETYVVAPKRPVNCIFTDTTLEKDIPGNTKVFRTASLGFSEDKLPDIRSEFAESSKPVNKAIWKVVKLINDLVLPIDKQMGWVPFALLKSIYVIRKYKIRNIYITAYPFSAFICGVILKKLFGEKIYWVADYRDAWQFAPLIKKNVLPFRYGTICRTEKIALSTADSIVFPTSFIFERYRDTYPWVTFKSVVITNGYDEDDFTNLVPKTFDKFTFVYMGKIHISKGNPIPLLEVIQQNLKVDYQYIHVGTIGKQMLKRIEDSGLPYQYLGYKPHQEALSYSSGADVNIIIINNDAESVGVYSGKLFELLRLGKPIFVVGPRESIIKDILAKTKAGAYACVDDYQEMQEALKDILAGTFTTNHSTGIIEQYSRQNCTKQLENLYLAGHKK
jgi:glycosyltransferase involved in cell wall biosynthesis